MFKRRLFAVVLRDGEKVARLRRTGERHEIDLIATKRVDQSMIDHGLYDEGFFVVIAPDLNYHVQDATEAYQAQLREPENGKVRFVTLTLEDVIEVIRLSDPAHAEALHRRYCDFWLVDGEVELNAAEVGLPAKRTDRKPAQAQEHAANPSPVETPPKRRNKTKAPAAD